MPNPIYETTASNNLSFTSNGTHGISLKEIVASDPNAGISPGIGLDVVAIPNVGRTMYVKEFPSQSAGIQFGGDSDIVNPMDTD